MIHLETMSEQIVFAARNIAHNLDFVPDDRLEWKPAEGGKSGLQTRPRSCLTARSS